MFPGLCSSGVFPDLGIFPVFPVKGGSDPPPASGRGSHVGRRHFPAFPSISRSSGRFQSSTSTLRKVQGQQFPKKKKTNKKNPKKPATERRDFPSLQFFSACFGNKNAAQALFPRNSICSHFPGTGSIEASPGNRSSDFWGGPNPPQFGEGVAGLGGSGVAVAPRAVTRWGHRRVAPAGLRGGAGGDFGDSLGRGCAPRPSPALAPPTSDVMLE